uniref:Uncharacterized protein n=1 Tax=Solanum lycopersicum TaxID=4081 RepID=A0A3Q7GK87_SOLLC
MGLSPKGANTSVESLGTMLLSRSQLDQRVFFSLKLHHNLTNQALETSNKVLNPTPPSCLALHRSDQAT